MAEIHYDLNMMTKTMEIATWTSELMECQEKAAEARRLCNEFGAYQGKATPDLDNIYDVFDRHFFALQTLYGAAIEFSINSFLEMIGVDGDLAAALG